MSRCWRALLLLMGSAALVAAQPEEQTRTVREERTVFLPYTQLDAVLGPEGRAVVLPYEKFLELWSALARTPESGQEPPPPVDAVLGSARYEGRVAGPLALLQGSFVVSVLTPRYARLALPLSGVAVSRALLDGKPALLTAGGSGLELLVRGPGEHRLELDFSAPVQADGPRNSVQLALPPVAVAALRITLPGTGLDLGGSMPSAPSAVAEQDGATVAEFPAGGLAALSIVWQPRHEATAADRPSLFVTSTQLLRLAKSAISSHAVFDVRVSQGAPDALVLALPPEFTPLSVEAPGLLRQRRDGRRLHLQFSAPLQGSVRIVLDGERALSGPAGEAVDAPLVVAEGDIEREQIFVAVLETAGLKVSAAAEGMAEVDPSELPVAPEGQGRVLQSFVGTRYPIRQGEPAAAPVLRLHVEPLEPELQTDAQTLLSVGADSIAAQIRVQHQIRNAGIFSVSYRIPGKLRITEVGPAKLVRGFRLQPQDGGQLLEVELTGRAEGRLQLDLRGETDRASDTEPVELPQVQTLGAVRERGVLGLALEPSFDARMGESSGLYPMDVRELPADLAASAQQPAVLAYRYNALPYAGQLLIERKKPKVTAEVIHRVTVTEDQLKIASSVNYTILYAGISELALEVPEDAGNFVDIEGAEIKEKTLLSAGKGLSRWRVVLQRPVLGSYALAVRFERSVPEIPVGQAGLVAVPAIRVLDVAREQGHIAIGKRPNLEVEPVPTDLEPIDPKELPAAARSQEVFLAYRYLKQPYALNLKVTRHEYESVLTTILNRVHLETVVSKEGLATTEMILEVQNTQRQYLELRLPSGLEDARILSLFVAGKAVQPAPRADGTTMVRMIQSAASDQAFTIRMVYQTRIPEMGTWPATRVLQAPEFLEVPVSRTTWRVYLPFGFRHYAFGGNLQPAQPWSQGWAEAMALWTREVHAPSLGMEREALEPVPVTLPVDKPASSEAKAGAGGVLPLEVSLAAEGQTLIFSKLGGAARLEVDSMSSGLYHGLHFTLLCAVVAACWVVPRLLRRSLLAVTPGRMAVLFLLAPVLASPFLPTSLQNALDMVFTGGLIAGAFSLGLALVQRSRHAAEAITRSFGALRDRGWRKVQETIPEKKDPGQEGGA